MPEVGWCNNCNVPILDGHECGMCHSRSLKLKFPKAELKPIFKEEKNLYRRILAENGVSSHDVFPKGMSFYNIMGEVVIDGSKVFRLSYDEKKQDWRVRFFKNFENEVPSFKGSDLKDLIKANQHILKQKEKEAVEFLRKTIKRYSRLPLAVSFSGGKDSAATLGQNSTESSETR